MRLIPTCYTATRLPTELAYVDTTFSRYEALSAERQIKNWSRKKEEALMEGDFNKLSSYAKKKF